MWRQWQPTSFLTGEGDESGREEIWDSEIGLSFMSTHLWVPWKLFYLMQYLRKKKRYKWDEDQLASVPFPNCIFSGCQLLIGCVCVLRAVVVQVNTPTSSAVRAADTLPVRSAEQVQRLSSCSGGWTTPRGAAASDREGAWRGRRVHMC